MGTTAVASTTSVRARASRSAPLVQREFRVDPEPATGPQRAAVRALQAYLDGMVTAFASNRLDGTDLRLRTTPRVYAEARRLIAEQVDKGYVLYGAWTFSIEPRSTRTRVAVLDVCINQRHTRRRDVLTDRPGPRNDEPYVQLRYDLNRLERGWVVVGYAGHRVPAC